MPELAAIGLGYAELVVFALHQQVAPAETEFSAVDTRSVRGKRASGDQLVEIDSQLGLVAERDCGPAHPGRAIGIDVRVEHGPTRQPGMQVPVLVMIGPSRQPQDEPYLFTIEESAILVAKIRAGQIGRGEIVLGGSFGPEG